MSSSLYNINKFIFLVVGLGAGIVVGLLARGCDKAKDPETVEIRDTVYLDSIRIQEKTKTKYIIRHDTICEYDTINQIEVREDTVIMPIYKYEYRDTIETDSSKIDLDIIFEGYKARIDSVGVINHYTFDVAPEVVYKRKPLGWSIVVGPYAGYGFNFKNGTYQLGPEVGIGISIGWGYRFK